MSKISAAMLMVAVDTLIGSLRVGDGGSIWKYNHDTRSRCADVLLELLAKTELDVDTSNPQQQEEKKEKDNG